MDTVLNPGDLIKAVRPVSNFVPSDLAKTGGISRPSYNAPDAPSLPGYCDPIPMPLVPEVEVIRVTTGHQYGQFGNQHQYSTRPGFNADGTRLVLNNKIIELYKTDVLFNGNKIDEVSGLCWNSTLPAGTEGELKLCARLECHEKQEPSEFGNRMVADWNDPDVIWGIRGGKYGNTLAKWNCLTNTYEDCYTMPVSPSGTDVVTLGQASGATSIDSRYLVISFGTFNVGPQREDVIDLVNCSLVATKSMGPEDNWTGMTTSGDYVIHQSNVQGAGDNFIVYDRNLNLIGDTGVEGGHSAMGQCNGSDVMYAAGQEGNLIDIPNATLVHDYSNLFQAGTGGFGHYSVPRDRLDRVYSSMSSTYDNGGSAGVPGLISFSLCDGNTGDFEFWGWHFTGGPASGDNAAEATVNHDGTAMLFTSTWGDATNNQTSYEFIARLKIETDADGYESTETYNLITEIKEGTIDCGQSAWGS